MPRVATSPTTRRALELLGTSIRVGRIRRGWTVDELAERVGVSKPTMIRIERGEPGVAIGAAFEAAVLSGVTLFHPDPDERARYGDLKRAELALLPSAVRQRKVDDDF
jgi:DNA-binding XRE family transcriptional regulator